VPVIIRSISITTEYLMFMFKLVLIIGIESRAF
jgi:hypothetical protein